MMNYYQAQLLNSLAVVITIVIGFGFMARFQHELVRVIFSIADKISVGLWW